MFRAASEGCEGAGEVGAAAGGPTGSGRRGLPARSMGHLNGIIIYTYRITGTTSGTSRGAGMNHN